MLKEKINLSVFICSLYLLLASAGASLAADFASFFERRPNATIYSAPVVALSKKGSKTIVIPSSSKVVSMAFEEDKTLWQFSTPAAPRRLVASADRTRILILYDNGAFDVVDADGGKKMPVDQKDARINDAVDAFATTRGFVIMRKTGLAEIARDGNKASVIAAIQSPMSFSVFTAPGGTVYAAAAHAAGAGMWSAKPGAPFAEEWQAKQPMQRADSSLIYAAGPSVRFAVFAKDQALIFEGPRSQPRQAGVRGPVVSAVGAYDRAASRPVLVLSSASGYSAYDGNEFAELWNYPAQLSRRFVPSVVVENDLAALLVYKGPTAIAALSIFDGKEIASAALDNRALLEDIEAAPLSGKPGLVALITFADAVTGYNLGTSFEPKSVYPTVNRYVTGSEASVVSDAGRSGSPVDVEELKALWHKHSQNIMIGLTAFFLLWLVISVVRRRSRGSVSKGGLKLSAKEAEAQIKRLREMLESSPENIELMLNLLFLLKATNQAEEVAELYKTLIRLRPAEEIYYEELLALRQPFFAFVGDLAAIYKRKGKSKSVIPMYEERIEKSVADGKLDIYSARILARLYVDEKRPKNAVEAIEKALASEPDSIEDLTLYYECLAQADDFEKASETLKKLINIDKSNNSVNHYSKLFQLYHKMKLSEEAVELFRIAMDARASAIDALMPFAGEYFNEAVKLGNKKIILLYGNCIIDAYNRQKNVTASMATIDKILAIFPGEKALVKKRAFFLLERGEDAGILDTFRALYESDKNDVRVKLEYSRLLLKSNKFDESLALVIDAVKKGETPDKFLEVAVAAFELMVKSGQGSKVVATASSLHEASKSKKVLAALGEAHLKLGDLDAAFDSYSRLLKEDQSESIQKRHKYIASLIEERKIAFMKNEDADAIQIIIDGENVTVKRPLVESVSAGNANPLELRLAEAKIHFERSEYKRAIPIFQELATMAAGKKEGVAAQIYLITCFLREKLNAAAVKVYDSIDFAAAGIAGRESLAYKYKIATLFQDVGEFRKAEVIFSDIAAQEMNYKDVTDRISAMKKKIAEINAASARAAASFGGDDDDRTTIANVATEADYIDKRYEIISQIGRGGMGIVYKARDTKENREVAIKIPILSFKGDRGFMDRFEREANVLGKLKHKNILQIFSVEGTELPYIVMEVLAGKSLKDIIKEKKTLSHTETRDIAVQCCDALGYTHKLNIVHRDIKPENIMMIAGNQVKLMDFGLAKAADDSTMTKAGTILGTFAYISPEQAMGSSVDGRSDIYSLGIMFYEMLAGEKPFTSGDFVHQHLKVKPPAPTKKNSKIPYPVEAIVLKCLEKSPADRFRDAEELKAAWEKIV